MGSGIKKLFRAGGGSGGGSRQASPVGSASSLVGSSGPGPAQGQEKAKGGGGVVKGFKKIFGKKGGGS